MTRHLSLTIVAIGLMTGGAMAQDAGQARQACRADYDKLCSSVSPGGGRIRQCMMDNIEKLSPECRAAVTASAARRNQERH